MYKHALHIFRRDLRLIDNTSLEYLKTAERVSVGFIFDPRQVEDNAYKSVCAIRFMLESLVELSRAVVDRGGVLNVWCGTPDEVIDLVLAATDIDIVSVCADYTPFSIARDARLAEVCKAHSVAFQAHHDALLTVPGDIQTPSGSAFKVFTPFYKVASSVPVATPVKSFSSLLSPTFLPHNKKDLLSQMGTEYGILSVSSHTGGRVHGLQLLADVGKLHFYSKTRDFPLYDHGTSLLSPHNKFGTLSIREVYHAIRESLGSSGEPLVRSLYWRDFFVHVAVAAPYVFGSAYTQAYNNLTWSTNAELFARWCEGKTGVPFVDAGMRQLNETGCMHNRVRMVTASFLVKDLHIDWQWGERYFAQKLVDYDPAVNNGNWQWIASTGCDSQPYFRIFNPWLQQKKFDPDAVYIKRWVPELRAVSAAQIHAAHKKPITGYCRPIVDHAIESRKARAQYKNVVMSAAQK